MCRELRMATVLGAPFCRALEIKLGYCAHDSSGVCLQILKKKLVPVVTAHPVIEPTNPGKPGAALCNNDFKSTLIHPSMIRGFIWSH